MKLVEFSIGTLGKIHILVYEGRTVNGIGRSFL